MNMAAPKIQEIGTESSGSEASDSVPEFSLLPKEHKEILQTHHPTIQALLDLDQIFPFLNEKKLLTDSEQEQLLPNSRYTNREKISILVSSLPKKGSRALYHFIIALRSSSDGTAHSELADILQSAAEKAVARKDSSPKGRVSGVWILTTITVLAVALLLTALVWYHGPSNIQSAMLQWFTKPRPSKSLRLKPENFVGREEELKEVSDLLDFVNPDTRIVSIIGGPGFGKSALAVSVGHQMLSRGVTVYYVDMTEVTSMQALAEKIIEGDESIVSSPNITVERMYKWARQLYYNTLLILDNCDDMLNTDHVKEDLQKAVKKLLENSEYLKILTTSRESTMHLSTFRLEWFQLHELQANISCNLLQFYSKHLTDTECEKIANLTGSVPLALKVVGSILNQPDPPSSATVISALEKQLLKTLSPKELPVDERVNSCISVSYHYLSPSVQQVGQFLANFPGSFSLDAAVGVYVLSSNIDITSAVNELVQRSLLHRSQPAKTDYRFQFHRLIREFFMEVQRSDHSDNIKLFHFGFISHFSAWLFHLMLVDPNEQQALKAIDQERHNILHFLQLLPVQQISNHTFHFSAAYVVGILFKTNLLQYRFTPHELYGPAQNIVTYLHNNCRLQLLKSKDCLASYLFLLHRLAKLEYQLHGVSRAVSLLEMHQDRVEEWSPVEKNMIVLYVNVYQQLSEYYKALGEDEKFKECHIKILRANKELGSCSPDSCDYHSIGIIYYNLGYYKESIDFLEKALEKGSLNVPIMGRARANLYDAYDKVFDKQRKEAVMRDMLDLVFPSLINISDEDILRFFDDISFLIKFYKNQEKTSEADALEERQLEAIKGAGLLPPNKIKELNILLKTFKFTYSFYNRSEYFKAVDMARFGLELYTGKVPGLKAKDNTLCTLMMIIAKAQFFSWNITEALESFDQAVDLIYTLNLTDEFTGELFWVCPLLLLRGNFECTFDIVGKALLIILIILLGLLIILIFGPLFLLLSPRPDYFDFLIEDQIVSSDSTELTVYQHSPQLLNSGLSLFLQTSLFTTLLMTLWHYIIKFWEVKILLKIMFRVPVLLFYLYVIYIWFQYFKDTAMGILYKIIKCVHHLFFIIFSICMFLFVRKLVTLL